MITWRGEEWRGLLCLQGWVGRWRGSALPLEMGGESGVLLIQKGGVGSEGSPCLLSEESRWHLDPSSAPIVQAAPNTDGADVSEMVPSFSPINSANFNPEGCK